MPHGLVSFNRTFMELKFPTTGIVINNRECFNRTFMELKLVSGGASILGGASFNRTFMELKFFKSINK